MEKITAIKILIGLVSAVLVFHTGILLKLIPYRIAWGGKLQNDSQMYAFEAISIIINLFLIFLLMMKGKIIRPLFSEKLINSFLWIYFGLFLLNTIGNLFAESSFEKGFTVITLLFSVLIWMVLKKEKKHLIK